MLCAIVQHSTGNNLASEKRDFKLKEILIKQKHKLLFMGDQKQFRLNDRDQIKQRNSLKV